MTIFLLLKKYVHLITLHQSFDPVIFKNLFRMVLTLAGTELKSSKIANKSAGPALGRTPVVLCRKLCDSILHPFSFSSPNQKDA